MQAIVGQHARILKAIRGTAIRQNPKSRQLGSP
jgi:hypothetical protein